MYTYIIEPFRLTHFLPNFSIFLKIWLYFWKEFSNEYILLKFENEGPYHEKQ